MFKRVAAVVVLYNPEDDVVKNIQSYIEQVQKLYVVDNSENLKHDIIYTLCQISKIEYFNNGGNKGIAYALNIGAKRAIEEGFEFLLTMDQDTELQKNFVSRLIKASAESKRVGIIAPKYTAKSSPTPEFEKILLSMTSGNLLNLEAYAKVGPFLEELFIDHVDHEYCLRLNQNGFDVLQVNSVEILHSPGNSYTIQFFHKRLTFSMHSPLRLYYFTRNGFYVAASYGKVFPYFKRRFIWLLLKEFIKVIFFDGKLAYLKMMLLGYRHFRTNKFGKFRSNN